MDSLNILDQLTILSTVSCLPDGFSCKTITNSNIELIAKTSKASSMEVAITAIKNKIMPERYIRNMATLSFVDQLKLLNTHVSIIGLGGLGGLVVENLARIGIGHFKLIDGDVFEDHNLNRQFLCSTEEVGKYKSEVAMRRITKINPSASIKIFSKYLTESNSDCLINDCEIAIDCLDNIKTRFILEAASKRRNIPMVSAAIAGTLGHITTIFPGDSGLERIFGQIEHLRNNRGVEITLGCLSHSVSAIASFECNEVIKIALGRKTLRNRLLVINMEDYTFEIFNLN